MFLSKLTLNLENPKARRDLADPYEMHRTLARLVGHRKDRLLWRLETGRGLAPPYVLIQTQGPQDWEALWAVCGKDYGELAPDSPKAFTPALRPGERLRFRLRANPSVMRNRKRYGLVGREAQLAWLTKTLARCGARVLAAEVTGKEWLVAGKKRPSPRVELLAVTFEGFLEVKHPETLLKGLSQGIGHGKAFGLGLLSLARR